MKKSKERIDDKKDMVILLLVIYLISNLVVWGWMYPKAKEHFIDEWDEIEEGCCYGSCAGPICPDDRLFQFNKEGKIPISAILIVSFLAPLILVFIIAGLIMTFLMIYV